MATDTVIKLTEEQENLLKSLEEEFKDRYTEKDEEFLAVLKARPSGPPVLDNWIDNRSNWRNDRNRYNNDNDRNYRDRRSERDYHGHRHRQYLHQERRPY